jgi:hypothetical protein
LSKKEDIARNRHIVREIIDVLILCVFKILQLRRGIYTEDKSNSMAI